MMISTTLRFGGCGNQQSDTYFSNSIRLLEAVLEFTHHRGISMTCQQCINFIASSIPPATFIHSSFL
eukprot:scaffold15312_cov126-Skeletonema_menzelii.AAC.1